MSSVAAARAQGRFGQVIFTQRGNSIPAGFVWRQSLGQDWAVRKLFLPRPVGRGVRPAPRLCPGVAGEECGTPLAGNYAEAPVGDAALARPTGTASGRGREPPG